MNYGRIVWHDRIVGVGAIESDSVDDDVSYHVTDITSDSDGAIGVNTPVRFDSRETETGPRAIDVEVLA